MSNSDQSRAEIFRLSKIGFSPDVASMPDYDFVVRIYNLFLNRDPEFSSLSDPIEGLTNRAAYVLGVMASKEAKIINDYNFQSLLLKFARVLGYTESAEYIANAIKTSYQTLDSILQDATIIAPLIEEMSSVTKGRQPVHDSITSTPDAPDLSAGAATHAFAGAGEVAQDISNPAVIGELFRILLRRPPTDDELNQYTSLLHSGALNLTSYISALVDLEEFGTKALTHVQPSRHVASTVISILMRRAADVNAVNGYSGALQNGYTLSAFLEELLGSDEFSSRRHGSGSSAADGAGLAQIGKMLDSMIAAKLAASGCAVPPSTGPDGAISPSRLRSMILTLSALSDQTQAA